MKILKIPAAAGAILLVGSLVACAQPGSRPSPAPTVTTTGVKAPLIQSKGKAQKQARPVDVEPRPWDPSVGEIYEFRTVVDEVTRYCLVFFTGGNAGGLHCFDSSEVP